MRSANASLRSARFAVEVALHELENSRAALAIAGGEDLQNALEVSSPIDGQVLSRLRQSEGRVQPGEGILILGDLSGLQVEVDVLSPDAVRLEPGMKVELERWGGGETLTGHVLRIEPAGFTRVSALGVEEQRVWVIVGFDAPRADWERLGDGYRIEARFILRENQAILQAPSSALFREEDSWYTFVVENDRAVRREIVPGERSGLMREILAGLESGDQVITHPGSDMGDGVRVRTR